MTINLEDPKHPVHLKIGCFYFWDGNIPDGYTGSVVNNKDTVAFFVNRKLHREDGPAVIRTNGTVEYWFKGVYLDKSDWEKKVSKNKPKPTMKSYKTYKDLYQECTGDSTKGNDGKFLIEETQEEVTVVNGVITSIVSVEKDSNEARKPKHSYTFPLTDNVRYVFQTSVEAKDVRSHVTEAHNYWIRDEKKVVYQSFKNVTKIPYMVCGDWGELENRFIRQRFILEDENVVVSTENNNIRSIESLTNGHFVSFPDDGTVTFRTLAVKLNELKNDLTYTKVKSWEEKLNTNFTGTVIDDDGFVAHFKNGKCHKDDGPALFKTKKDVHRLYDWYWFKDGMIHREDGPYAVTEKGTEYYALNDKAYYEDKKSWERAVKRLQAERELTVLENHDRWTDIPTKDFTGVIKTKAKTVAYYKNGKLHRETGPAFIVEGFQAYYLNGEALSKSDWVEKLNSLPEEEKEVVKLETNDNNKQKEYTKEGHLKVRKWNAFEGVGSFTGSVVDEAGVICYYKNGIQHRDGNQPSFISNIGKDYKVNGKLHRTNGPAIEYANGNTSPAFFLNGEKVSELELYTKFPWKVSELGEKPKNFNGTVDYGNFVTETFRDGQLHSYNDKPAHTNGEEYQCWYEDGKRHRIGGPARINGNIKEYWVEGKLLSKEEYWLEFPWDEATQGYPNDRFTGTIKRKNGDVETWLDGLYHSFDDKPSYISADGTVKMWHKKGNWHRETGPVKIDSKTNNKVFYIDGKLIPKDEYYFKYPLKVKSSIDVPENFTGICVDENGITRYKKDGKYHRENGPAWENPSTGEQKWCVNGLRHRVDGPAGVSSDGTKCWFQNDKLHRENGPAVEYAKYGKVEYWWEGKEYSSAEAFYTEHPLKLKNNQCVPDNFTGVAEWDNGIIRHYKDGQAHRKDGPAFLNPRGVPGYIKEGWYEMGVSHRENGPARVSLDGTEQYYHNGVYYKDAQAYYSAHPVVLEDENMFSDIPSNFSGKVKLKNSGIYKTYLNGKVHSYNDKPAIGGDDAESWWKEGNLHRENGPAHILNGEESYYWEGKKYESVEAFYEEHPLRLSSMEDSPGDNFTGKVVWEDHNITAWYKNGKLHRDNDLPAFVSDKEVSWFKNGSLHREGNRHAKILSNGHKGYFVEGKYHRTDGSAYESNFNSYYYLNGIRYKTKEDWQKAKYQLGIDKLPYNVVDEATQEVSYRIARKQLVTLTRKFLAEQVAEKASTVKQRESAYSSALEFLSSELGTSVVYGAVGLVLPKLGPSLPERFRVHLDRLGKEFRVSSMASVGVEVTDLLASTVGKALKGLPSSETYSLGSVSLKEKTTTTTTTLEKEIVYEQHTAKTNNVQGN